MRQFEVRIENRIGALALVCEVLSGRGINIKAIATELREDRGVIKFITNDELTTRAVLKEAGFEFSEYEIIPVRLKDEPGELARLARGLSNLNIDIESVFLLNREKGVTEIAFKVNDLKGARNLIG
ncbi:MAG: hypothetical protein ACE5J7_01215 [Candidatus Aenigmatarchaeota archaeon]